MREAFVIAASQDEPLLLPFPNRASAQATRFKLYAFAKAYRENPSALANDPEMAAAADSITIGLVGESVLSLQYGANTLLAEVLTSVTGVNFAEMAQERGRELVGIGQGAARREGQEGNITTSITTTTITTTTTTTTGGFE